MDASAAAIGTINILHEYDI